MRAFILFEVSSPTPGSKGPSPPAPLLPPLPGLGGLAPLLLGPEGLEDAITSAPEGWGARVPAHKYWGAGYQPFLAPSSHQPP